MNKYIFLTTILGISLLASCSKENYTVDYTAEVKMEFAEGGDSSIVHVKKGAKDYQMKIDVVASGEIIRLFEIYDADTKSGNRGDLIDGTSQSFDNPEKNYSTTLTVSDLTQNKCIKVVVTDTMERVYEKNLLIKITPAVQFSEAKRMETIENYYGPYYASWLSGRVYMRNTEYGKEIDFSLGDIVMQSEGTEPIAALVNPALRSDYHLLTAAGLQHTKFTLTPLTPAQYNAITPVDATPILKLKDPALDAVKLDVGSTYLFKTENGKKGLIHITGVTTKTGTFENVNGQWEESVAYHEVTLTTKTVSP